MGRRRGAADTSRKGVRISWRRSNQDASPHIIPGLQPGNTTLVEGCHAPQTERWLFGKRRPTISWTLVLWACPAGSVGSRYNERLPHDSRRHGERGRDRRRRGLPVRRRLRPVGDTTGRRDGPCAPPAVPGPELREARCSYAAGGVGCRSTRDVAGRARDRLPVARGKVRRGVGRGSVSSSRAASEAPAARRPPRRRRCTTD